MNIPPDWQLPPQISSRIGERPGRQRAMFHDGHLFLILHKVPVGRTPQRSAVYFYRTPEGQWFSNARGSGQAVFQLHMEAYEKTIDALEDKMRNAKNATSCFEILQAIQPVHQTLSKMVSTLQSAREKAGPDKTLITMRDRATDADQAAALVHEEARNAMEFNLAMQAERQASHAQRIEMASHRLNVLAAIFLPVMAMASLFGMNFPSGLEPAGPWFFWGVAIFGMCTGFVIILAANRR